MFRRILCFLTVLICFAASASLNAQDNGLPPVYTGTGIADAAFAADAELIPVTGTGTLSITIESFHSKNLRRAISMLADRVEIWLGDNRLASMDRTDAADINDGKQRIFSFPDLYLPKGYYFITVRLYSMGAAFDRRKWHGETFQVGIHPGRTTRVHKKIPFYNY